MAERQLLFSVTKKDLRTDYFRCGGNGGQNVNKRDTGVRITHPASGAVAESREQRSQGQNKATAFRRLVKSPEFEKWRRREAARRLGIEAEIEVSVEQQMAPANLRTEVHDEKGRWVEADPDTLAD